MHSSAGGIDADRRCPRLAPGWVERATALSPTEGFLLSRIDGHTPWAVLRQIGGLLPEEADLVLEGWLQTGLVLLDDASPTVPAAQPPRAAAAAQAPASGPAAIDPSLQIDVALQRVIVAFEARLSQCTYHEILGVGKRSDDREIKRAYFKLSKQFHPDRYFRRNIGDHAARLDRIFKHVALAYELLSDPATRVELERGMEDGPPLAGAAEESAQPATAPAQAKPAAGGYRTPSRMENLARLRKRFKMPTKVLAERRFRARQFHDAARAAAHQKRWLEAAASARLAIAFDPWTPDFREHFASIQADVHAVRAAELLEQAGNAGAASEALRLIDEAIHYRPADAALHARGAALAIEAGEVTRAREFAESACELAPEVVANHVLLCRVFKRIGDAKAARNALSAAVKLDPKDPEVLAEQRLLLARRAR
jgi:curved DNA-binding protein CbpA